ncbi:unnamed protein product [Zymoseptoria tritici ST99CH_3D1]|nr:unnamed protein product [Zymoseptoria tritici ST99CH_3D1]
MLECRACALRCIRAIAGDVWTISTSVQRPLLLTPRLTNGRQRRSLASTATAKPFPAKRKSKDAVETENKEKGLTLHEERALQTELEFLKDPVKLAEHVHYTLRNEKPQKALDLCRLASRNMSCIVSWNHTIDWHMKRGRVNDAIKIYNEMKKRGQFPDSYTYMLLFRGFSQDTTKLGAKIRAEAVSKATNIYNSMTSPTSRVKPSIMHTNAVLRLCALAGDMDALWGVAGKIPEHGPGSADTITYTTLLSAIRFDAIGSIDGTAYVEQIGPQRQQAVNEGRRIWQEVIAKWRSGELQLDAELVSQMGNLLRISKRIEDWDDVLSLVQQTTSIERQIAPVGSPERRIEHVRLEPVDKDVEEEPASVVDEDGWVPTPASNAFKPVAPHAYDPQHPKRPTRLAWVEPGNPILSSIIRACTLMRIPKTALAYWNIITSEPYNIKPDMANYQAILRLYGINRQSGQAASLIQQMHDVGIQVTGKTYRDALDVCARNHKSSSTMEHATQIIDNMQKHMAYPDVPALRKYLSLALTTDSGHIITTAIDRLDPFIHILRSRMVHGVDKKVGITPEQRLDDKDETAGFFRNVISVIDTLMSRELVPREQFKLWHERRSQLNALLTRSLKTLTTSRSRLQQRRSENFDGSPAGEQGKDSADSRNAYTPVPDEPRWKQERLRPERAVRDFVQRRPGSEPQERGHYSLRLDAKRRDLRRDSEGRDNGMVDLPGELAMREQ